MELNQTLDVRDDQPARRHATILGAFDRLDVGAAFVLINDHDPKPLYYQLAAEQGHTFHWEYLEQGPSVWRVRISRTAPADEAPVASRVELVTVDSTEKMS